MQEVAGMEQSMRAYQMEPTILPVEKVLGQLRLPCGQQLGVAVLFHSV